LTEEEVKEFIHMIEENHNMMRDCFNTYVECHSKYIQKLNEHFFPGRFTICEVSMGDLNEMMEKSYGSFSFASELRRMTRPEVKDES
jgi:hypothetical protein